MWKSKAVVLMDHVTRKLVAVAMRVNKVRWELVPPSPEPITSPTVDDLDLSDAEADIEDAVSAAFADLRTKVISEALR